MFDLDEDSETRIDIKLFKDVENIKSLKQRLMKGELNCCIVKPTLIVDPFQIVVAANKALISEKRTTKSVFTEILFNLSISKNITNSLKTFGIEDSDKHILVVIVNEKGEDNSKICSEIHGEELELMQLKNFSDVKAIQKVYKIHEDELSNVPLLDSVVSRIAVKDFL
ncbi:unnamed protein product [Acanthoscelides obtectus]|uniref:Uncharacterized protein n=1 Tax=Acanthoscelides obtectus TaxID=200917 RepID=A0A9P0P762_ACAOB|nr:unnamed protein product [Acanthoscelides obtectus]CAK1635761.1 EKC/KEOPS complex subunit TPRKB [Acanthoscelides obtectus]